MLDLVVGNQSNESENNSAPLPKDVIILRRMRIFRKITREDAGRTLSRSAKLLERFENGRQNLSIERKKQLVRRYRYTWEEYLQLVDGKSELPVLPSRSIFKRKTVTRIHGRKYQKQISKASRVLKILRKMQGWTRPQAAQKCSWSRSCIDHLENGRVEVTEEKVAHVLRSYSCAMKLFAIAWKFSQNWTTTN